MVDINTLLLSSVDHIIQYLDSNTLLLSTVDSNTLYRGQQHIEPGTIIELNLAVYSR